MQGVIYVDPARAPEGTRFGFVMTDDTMEPYLKRGTTVYAQSPGPLAPGDVGVFLVKGKLLCRQYLEDSEGTAYLFTLNRSRRNRDLALPAASVTLFARVPLPEPAPLPGIE